MKLLMKILTQNHKTNPIIPTSKQTLISRNRKKMQYHKMTHWIQIPLLMNKIQMKSRLIIKTRKMQMIPMKLKKQVIPIKRNRLLTLRIKIAHTNKMRPLNRILKLKICQRIKIKVQKQIRLIKNHLMKQLRKMRQSKKVMPVNKILQSQNKKMSLLMNLQT